MNDYKNSITINNTAGEVYKAITEHVSDWWSDDFVGAAAKKGDWYTIAFGKTQKTFEVIEAIPNRQVTWLCLKAYIDAEELEKKNEWEGTKLIWTIAAGKQGTTLSVLHEGLNKSIACYDLCAPAWDYFMTSIQALLTTGNGTPYHKQEARLKWEEQSN